MTKDFSAYIASRGFGQAAVTVISEGSCFWAPKFDVPEAEWRRAVPEADTRGRIQIGFNVAHVRVPGASIVIDPGFDDPTSAWQQRFAERSPNLQSLTRTPGLNAALARLGIRPDEVTHVLLTHAHRDHFPGVTREWNGRQAARFPRARHLLGRADWDGNPQRGDPASDHVVRLSTIEGLGLLDLIDREREIAPGVTWIPAPGETPGHTIVRFESAGHCFYYLGDLFHHTCEVEHPDWMPPGRDLAANRRSRDTLLREAARGRALLVFSHGRFPAWGNVVPTETGYRWEPA